MTSKKLCDIGAVLPLIAIVFLIQFARPTISVINTNDTKLNDQQSPPQSQQQQRPVIRGTSEEVFSSNDEITFQYEPDEFVNKKKQSSSATSTTISTTTNKPLSLPTNQNKQQEETQSGNNVVKDGVTQPSDQQRNFLLPPPASTRANGGRSGRMLDLDVLMGEKSPVRERSMTTGNRQSRYINSGSNALDMLGNKKLKIQGFIPIVSMKDDDSSDETTSNEANGHNNNNNNNNNHNLHQRFLQQSNGLGQSDSNLPYAQSSIGHASFVSGIQRYLPSNPNEPPQFVANTNDQAPSMYPNQQQQHQSISMKSSVVDTLKRPLKRLASLTSHSDATSAIGKLMQTASGQDCLCVPFYMCKNGFVSESSVSKAQIQQMIAQQLQQGPRSQTSAIATSPDDQMPSSLQPIISSPANTQLAQMSNNNGNQVQYANSIVPVDERSMERDLISSMNFASSLGGNLDDQSASNKTINSSLAENDNFLSGMQQLTSGNSDNSTNSQEKSSPPQPASTTEDYSQEILGRMLGLRSPTRMSGASVAGLTSSSGSCGVLRTCCAIPPHLLSTGGSPLTIQAAESNLYGQTMMKQQHQQQQQSSLLHNQQVAQQRYQQSINQNQVSKAQMNNNYGFPAGSSAAASASMMLQQPYLNNNNNNNQLATLNLPMNMAMPNQDQTSLAHRSTQFQQLNNQFQQLPPSNSRAQYQMSQLPPSQMMSGSQILASQPPSWQQQQQNNLKQVNNNNNNLMRQQNNNFHLQQQPPLRSSLVQASQSAGSRKILDGRCGIRQSSGINGRVQNLQYQENSADFGEYPAQAAILKKLSGSDSLFVCGGTLISQYWLATAAHCIKKHMTNELKVRLGEWDVHRDDEFYPFVEKDIRDVVIHPEFVSGNLVNDIALLRLDSPVDPTLPHVNPACLPALDESFARQKCWVTGWGKDSFGQKGTFQSVLQEVELPVAEHGECEMALRQTRLGPHYRLHPGFICAGGEGGRDACEGDGGSGLYCVQPDGIIKVAGLVSWGIGCGQAGVPGVYVNMAHYRSWIENIIAIDEDVYSPYMNTLAGNLISERSNENGNTTMAVAQAADNSTSITTTPKP